LRRDLHEGVGSSVAAALLHLQAAEDLIHTDPKAAQELIGRVKREASAVVMEIRRLADCLGHSPLDQVGLVSAIQERASCMCDIESRDGTGDRAEVTVEAVGNLEDLPAATEMAAFYIVSEALADALRYGTASSCRVRLSRQASDLELEVVSDGYDPAMDLQPGKSVSSMRERADALGGALSVESVSGGMTALRARLPLRQG
jgi:signal transduction histidine kinase